MNLLDLLKRGALTTAASENSKNSENSCSKGTKVASDHKYKKIKNSNSSNNSYSCAQDREDLTEPLATGAIANPAIVATDCQPVSCASDHAPDCFSPEGTLEAVFREAVADGWTDDQLCDYIDALREAGALRSPWGIKVRDSPSADDLWFISDATARERLPPDACSFTLDELRPIVEVSRVFPEAKVIKVIRAEE